MAELRLDKIIADSGAATRSEARALIKKRAVTVDGAAVLSPEAKFDPEAHTIVCAGQKLNTKRARSFMLHKPEGVVSATEDREQKTVIDLLPRLQALGFPVAGIRHTGLLILTNDVAATRSPHPPSVLKSSLTWTEARSETLDPAAIGSRRTRCCPQSLKLTPRMPPTHGFISTRGSTIR